MNVQVVHGAPDPDELAALVAALAAVGPPTADRLRSWRRQRQAVLAREAGAARAA
jgi:Acyl-CoA carboxylase epsilon subunit